MIAAARQGSALSFGKEKSREGVKQDGWADLSAQPFLQQSVA